jgi:hypothetical protein
MRVTVAALAVAWAVGRPGQASAAACAVGMDWGVDGRPSPVQQPRDYRGAGLVNHGPPLRN